MLIGLTVARSRAMEGARLILVDVNDGEAFAALIAADAGAGGIPADTIQWTSPTRPAWSGWARRWDG